MKKEKFDFKTILMEAFFENDRKCSDKEMAKEIDEIYDHFKVVLNKADFKIL